MKEILIQLMTAFLGSMGFALMFGIRRKYLLSAALGGLLAWAIYLGAELIFKSIFFPCLLASVFAVTYAEILARRKKTPATLFVISAIIPLVPGGALYETMSAAVRRDLETVAVSGHRTLVFALAISAGISFVTACRELRARKS